MDESSAELNLPPVIKDSNKPETQARVDKVLTQMEDDQLHEDPSKTKLELISANKQARDQVAAELRETRAKLRQEQAEVVSETDPLTGVLNRRGFESKIKALSPDEEATHLFIDINDLKKLNEELGHQGADEKIKEITLNLRDIFGENAIIARTGGDEFQVVITGDPTEAFNKFVTQKMPSVSAGATSFNHADPIVSEQLADSGTYTAKLLKGDGVNHLVVVQDEENSVEYKPDENVISFPQQNKAA